MVPESFLYLNRLARLSPDTRVYSNTEPTMLFYDGRDAGVNITIGKDSRYYHPECPNVMWNDDRQSFGFTGVRRLFQELTRAWEQAGGRAGEPEVPTAEAVREEPGCPAAEAAGTDGARHVPEPENEEKGGGSR